MRLSQSTIRQVRDYEDIVGFIGSYVGLKRRGRNYIGLCPFHSERTPSFTVSPDKKIFHCFGCHHSGDLIEFVRLIDNLTFSESVAHIAERIGITVEYDEHSRTYSPQEDHLKDELRSILLLSLSKFHDALLQDETALGYLTGRGLTLETISRFHLGFSPLSFSLVDFILENGFSKETLLKSGLVYEQDTGHLANRFRSRIVFPIMDHLGHAIGLAGRVWQSDQMGAKYVNSEENLIFNKRKILYGLHLAKRAIRDKESIILVEGYMDVMMLHQYGFTNAVACMGTALTTEQIAVLKRFTGTVYLAMDQDEAGQQSMERSLQLFLSSGLTVYVVSLDQKDPADFLALYGAEPFQDRLKAAEAMVMFMYRRLKPRYDLSKIEQVSSLLTELEPFLTRLTDTMVRVHYIQYLALDLHLSEEMLIAKLSKTPYNASQRLYKTPEIKHSKRELAELYILYVASQDLRFRQLFFDSIKNYRFSRTGLDDLWQYLQGSIQIGPELMEALLEHPLKRELSEVMVYSEHHHFSLPIKEEWRDYLSVIEKLDADDQVTKIKLKLKQIEEGGDPEEIAQLLRKLQDFKAMQS